MEIFQRVQTRKETTSDIKSYLDEADEFERQSLKDSPSVTPFGKRKLGFWINLTYTTFFVNIKIRL